MSEGEQDSRHDSDAAARPMKDAARGRGVEGKPKNMKEGAITDGDTVVKESYVTEKPVLTPEAPRTCQYVVTVDNKSMQIVKIERLNEKTGTRTELTRGEYAAAYPSVGPRTSRFQSKPQSRPFASPVASPTANTTTAFVEAYSRGVADYIKLIRGW